MLQLRPTCEHCNTALPPACADARICSYECTFCANCVDSVLGNVCPNCGGGFVPRPVRPARAWRAGTSLADQPATLTTKHRPVNAATHAALVAKVGAVLPAQR